MKKWQIIAGIIIVVIIALAGFFVLPITKQTPPSGQPRCASLAPGEWEPGRGECPGTTPKTQIKCNEFCEKHPDCCGQRDETAAGGIGEKWAIPPLPDPSEVLALKRNYPEIIKAINEGPNIYTRQGPAEIFNDEKIEAIKAVGFNAVQALLIGERKNGRLVFNPANNAVLLNDIVALKKHGLAVWAALDLAGPPEGKIDLGDYGELKASFLEFVEKSAELMEEYKVEYLTVNNEVDKPFKEQKQWSARQINEYLADFMPATNAAARRKFSGKLINKITKTRNHAKEVIDASFKNVDIAGVDIGPPMDSRTVLNVYRSDFGEYQYFALLAQKAGLPWMNAEYWQGDFDSGYTDFAKNNELACARISFDAYLKTVPKGVGFVWNDIRTFSLPQGEETKKALKEFFAGL